MKKITILITDDHKLLRDTWKILLSSHPAFEVTGEASSGEEAIEQVLQLDPDVVLMDINLRGEMNGIEATRLIRERSPNTKVLGVSMHAQSAYARKMIKVGAMGYVTKNSASEEMFAAIMEVSNGRKYICREIRDIISDQQINGSDDSSVHALTKKEIEVIGFVKQGYSSREIALELNISVKTAEVHRHNILKKLNVKNTAALVNRINNSQVDLDINTL
jgi:DNA-binding NarL/FixJ family response regulator